jgi:uncharacterized protein (DUF983 family)
MTGVTVALRRALRLRCPACGVGRVFRRGFERATDCGACGRRLDRDEGHWLGGSEVHMVVAFGTSVALALPLVLAFDLPGPALDALAAVHLALSIAIYRHARALFLALDHALDPAGTPPPGRGGGREPPGEPAPSPFPGPVGGARTGRRSPRPTPATAPSRLRRPGDTLEGALIGAGVATSLPRSGRQGEGPWSDAD